MTKRALLLATMSLLAAAGTSPARAQARVVIDSSGTRRLEVDGAAVRPGRWLYTLTLRIDTIPARQPAAEPAPLPALPAARADTGVARTEPPLVRPNSGTVRADAALVPRDSLVRHGSAAPRDTLVRRDSTAVPPGVVRRDSVGVVAAPGGADSTAARRSLRFLGDVEMTVAPSAYGATPSWLLTETGVRGGIVIADSLWLTQSVARPQHWVSTQGRAALALEFVGDTVYGATMSPLRRRSIMLGAVGDLLVNGAMTDLVLRLLPLGPTVSDSVSVLVVDVGGAAVVPARLAVVGDELVTAIAGIYDCWVVELETERGRATYWVRKTDPVVLRAEQALPQLGGAVLRRELVRGG